MKLISFVLLAACGGSAPPPKSPAAPGPSQPAPRSPEPTSDARYEDEAQRYADLLTGDGESGKTEGDMSARRPYGADLGQQIKDVRDSGASVAIGGGSGRGSRGDGDAAAGTKVGTGAGPRIDGPAGPPAPPGPTGRVSVAAKSGGDNSTLTPDIVLSKVQSSYLAGVKRCYKAYLAKDPTARGRLALAFTVNPSGRVRDNKATFPAREVGDCVAGQMAMWRFPIPKDKDGDATDAPFAITLQLVPE